VNWLWKVANNVSLRIRLVSGRIRVHMHAQTRAIRRKPHEEFRLHFKSRMRQLLERYPSPAVAFGPAWEATVAEVPIPDVEQGTVYWQLIDWARTEELFTRAARG